MKALLLAVVVCTAGIVGGGVWYKAQQDGTDPLALVKEKLDAMQAEAPSKTVAKATKGVAVALADPAAEPEEEPKSPPKKAPAKAAKPEAKSEEPAQEPAPKAEPKTEPKAEPKTSAEPKKETKKAEPKTEGKAGEYPDDQKKILNEIRLELSERRLPAAKEKIAAANKLDGSDAFKAEVERLDTLHGYLVQFWKAVDEGGKRVGALDEVVIGSTTCSVIEYANETLVLRVDGLNKRWHLSEMGLKMCLRLASSALKVDDPTNKVIVGAFLAMDKKGDKEQARKYWEEGKKAGIETASLMPELGIVGPKQLNVPQNLTPPMKAQLVAASWLARREKNGKFIKGPLGPIGRNVQTGHLALILDSTQTDPVQIVNSRRRLTGDFTFRMILDDVKEGQIAGIFSADDKAASHFVQLPAGVVHLEFSRKGDKYECNLNGTMVEVEHSEGAPANLPGMAGVSLTPGSNCALAYFEFVK